MDDEDIARMTALSETMSQTVIDAFTNRFKTPTQENMMIIISALNRSMIFFLDHVVEEDRKRMIEGIHLSMKCMQWSDDQ
jgi:hypothetical protein